ncbi:thioredoxin reductase (NADPH) [Orenia metallireducens]|uniref:Thioredoxin reductase (NADPH) n=1 Tax=Orenia metallireducens TaxID=1413210 RepID=A0A285IKL4_9FIRM|nr:NAD(P)/FAD-dependent oxidoreductase [Orenia metallireducens]PRX17212.1 thioredoxin reductase (NADPH) [Orenia metallireducens]SNY47646.1 thioredoxin reductase (NADPH) [Orenia metallireducens]
MQMEEYDIIIVGAGPAGMSAAINAKARNKSVAIFEGGQIAKKIDWAPHVNNYLGFSNVSGPELAQAYIKHIEDLEIPIIKQKVVKAFPMGEKFMVTTNGENYQAKKLILALGVIQQARLKGEKEYIGKGVSYCATCDGMLYKGKDVMVISDSAHHEEEANFLADICENVYYVAQYKEIENLDERIQVIDAKVEKITGEQMANKVKLTTGEYDVACVFILRETVPPTEIVDGLELASKKYIKVNRNLETNVAGVYAAGDCTGEPLQISKATGEGQVAALNAVKEIGK